MYAYMQGGAAYLKLQGTTVNCTHADPAGFNKVTQVAFWSRADVFITTGDDLGALQTIK